jgi:flagellin-like protein
VNITNLGEARRRKAVSGIFGSLIMFAMLFTAGIGFFVFINTTTLKEAQANQQQQQALQQASEEMLSIRLGLSTKPDPWGQTGDLWLRISNTGSSAITVIDVFVTNTAMNRIMSNSMVTKGTQYLATFSLPAQGDLNYSLPLTILPGFSTAQMSGCGSSPGCDIAISKASYDFTGSPVVVSVLTSTGSIFSAQYPSTPGATTVTVTQTSFTNSTTTWGGGNPGGNVLVVQMVASPTQTFACTHCLNDTVTIFNYGLLNVTDVSLSPAVPLPSLTGSAKVSSTGPCTLINGTKDKEGNLYIQAYPGSGEPYRAIYLCTYSANPNGFGGFASFTGQATGTYNKETVTSSSAISNPVQVGGPVSVLNQGPFSGNFFFFKYSACTTLPSGNTPCATKPSPVTAGNLPTASLINGNSSYYVAFYIQITNNYNVTIPILPYTYFMTDPTSGGESPFYIVGNPGGYGNPNLPYIPNYDPGVSGEAPTLTSYPSTCIATSTASCINVAPGNSTVITFAACDIGSTWWDWGGSAYGNSFDSGNTCTTRPPQYTPDEATYLTMLITFAYNGQVYTQQIPFVGQTVT